MCAQSRFFCSTRTRKGGKGVVYSILAEGGLEGQQKTEEEEEKGERSDNEVLEKKGEEEKNSKRKRAQTASPSPPPPPWQFSDEKYGQKSLLPGRRGGKRDPTLPPSPPLFPQFARRLKRPLPLFCPLHSTPLFCLIHRSVHKCSDRACLGRTSYKR